MRHVPNPFKRFNWVEVVKLSILLVYTVFKVFRNETLSCLATGINMMVSQLNRRKMYMAGFNTRLFTGEGEP